MIEFFYDCSSPWTYLGFESIEKLGAELDVPIAWKPVLVGAVFNAVNPSVYAQRANPVPAAARGRVFALVGLTVSGMSALSAALSGWLAEAVGARGLFGLAGVLGALTGLAGLWWTAPALARASVSEPRT